MSPRVDGRKFCPSVKSFILVGTALSVAGWAGCNSPASRVGSGASTGAATGAAVGLLAGANSNIGPLAGLAGGAAAGAGIGAIVGAIKQSRENKDQAEMQQERVYQAERAARMKEEATQKMLLEKELAVAQGFQISNFELEESQKRREKAEAELKNYDQQLAEAEARSKKLKDDQEKTLELEAQIAMRKEMLARLKGEAAPAPTSDKAKQSSTASSSDAK